MVTGNFVEGVRWTADRHGMDLSRPLVLVSGGPDSVALLRAILVLGGRPAVLHVDHGLRGDESRADADFVRSLCEELGVRCRVERLDLGNGPNLQERAREGRYRLAREVSAGLGLGVVATGHTADDVAETVVLNLSRGAGLRGLASIPPTRDGLVRPLIDRTRREVLRYLSDLGQPFRTDPTNLSGKYARNRVRLEVLPVLEELHPGAAANLARAASLAREDLETLEALADAALQARGAEVVLPREALLSLPPSLRRHAVRRAYARVLPGAPPPESRHVESVLALVEAGPGTRPLDLPGGAVAVGRGGDEISFYVPGEIPSGEEPLREGEVAFGGWVFRVEEVGRYDRRDAARPGVAYLGLSSGPYRVRTAREGDMIRPLGLGGRKKVFRAMMDRKVPADLRRRTPVVVGRSGEVAWVPFGELGEDFKVGRDTGRILKVEVAKTP
ncbi:MAG: tRNA lysidine(34) synthetase TilS [Rubrobacter sp.]|jgi:tRNA(Ile)-lysidine synthase|nr:tRNA lysidine(34) synthetase TilS [Rubrobacter sp.]